MKQTRRGVEKQGFLRVRETRLPQMVPKQGLRVEKKGSHLFPVGPPQKRETKTTQGGQTMGSPFISGWASMKKNKLPGLALRIFRIAPPSLVSSQSCASMAGSRPKPSLLRTCGSLPAAGLRRFESLALFTKVPCGYHFLSQPYEPCVILAASELIPCLGGLKGTQRKTEAVAFFPQFLQVESPFGSWGLKPKGNPCHFWKPLF